MTHGFKFFVYIIDFSTHILTRRMTEAAFLLMTGWSFQLTSSQGGWLSQYTAAGCSLFFQLTSSQGGWLFLANQKAHLQFFNSHPHKEDDEVESIVWSCMRFSTHILTRRMTYVLLECDNHIHFSTHILTRRMTKTSFIHFPGIFLFNSHPHKEDDCCRSVNLFSRVFSTHILTRRMTQWRVHLFLKTNFSTHILTRRMTVFFLPCHSFPYIFQLTSSQGGWPNAGRS